MASQDDGKGSNLGPSVRMVGTVAGNEPMTISGQVKGRIEIPSHLVVVTPKADIEADIKANEILIHGKVRGNVNGLSRVELTKTADLTGQLQTREIRVEDGAVFRGQVDIVRDKEPAKQPPNKP